MSLTFAVSGYIPADDNWNKMKAVWDTCTKANIPVPTEVDEFFDYKDPNDLPGLEVDIEEAIEVTAVKFANIWEVDLRKLPRKDIQFIRFVVSS